jgi:hypothetical protein
VHASDLHDCPHCRAGPGILSGWRALRQFCAMTERPDLPFPSQFRDESIDLMLAHGGPVLKGGHGKTLQLGLGWMAACGTANDAKLAIDGGAMQLIDVDRRMSELGDVLAGWGTSGDTSLSSHELEMDAHSIGTGLQRLLEVSAFAAQAQRIAAEIAALPLPNTLIPEIEALAHRQS